MTRPRLVAIVGPTAAGKSALALDLALRHGGEIVNADSRQVYRGMDIGTAKPSPEDRRKARHHLYDVAEPADGYSLALYQQQAKKTLNAIWARNAFAWLVGGTGQYVWSLLEAWQVPDVAPDEALRVELEAFAAEHGHEALASRLAMVDPAAAARIDHRNVRRVIRAIEVYEKSGRTMSEWQSKGTPDFEFLLFGIDLPRDVLYPRMVARDFAPLASSLILKREYEKLLEHAEANRHSPIAWLLQQGTRAYLAALDAALYEVLGDSRFMDYTPQRRSWWKRKGGAK
mgnify:CR=1 FL=1